MKLTTWLQGGMLGPNLGRWGACVREVRDKDCCPFFIVGSGRSGSTLLRMMLISHSRFSIPPETGFFHPLIAELNAARLLGTNELDRAVDIITRHYRWPDMRLDANDFRQRAHALRNPTLRNVVEVIYKAHLDRDNKPRWGDKTPSYIHIAPQLAAMFPAAKFIHLIRDGRDVARSFQNTGWAGPWLHDNLMEWKDALIADEKIGNCPGVNILRVHYENLITRTERTLRTICAFLEEEFDPSMLTWTDNVQNNIPTREQTIHGKLKKKPTLDDIHRWRIEMTAKEVFVAEAFIGGQLQRVGYDLKYKSAVWAPIMLLAKLYCLIAAPTSKFLRKAWLFLLRKAQLSKLANKNEK